LADYLVRKGMPFRTAHETVGRIVMRAIENGKEIEDLPIEELRSFSQIIGEDIYEALTLEKTLASKSQTGGTAPSQVALALRNARLSLSEL
jgi:argininosuccinate lyase